MSNLQKVSQYSTTKDGNFPRKGFIFGGGKGPVATRPSTSSGSIGFGINYGSTTSHGSSVSSTSLSSAGPNLTPVSLTSNSPEVPAYTTRIPSIVTANTAYSPERRPGIGYKSKSPSSKSSGRRKSILQASPDIFIQDEQNQPRALDRDSISSTAPYSKMLSSPFPTSYAQGTFPGGPQSPTLETITYQHIQETASKRISTLDYLRKAHEGRVYWFNTLLFNKPDLARIPYFDSRKLTRRATNYLLLGLSLPPILDLNSSNSYDFLRALNSLLAEFESYQQMHPPDGSSSSSLSRARLPQMFKRATGSAGGKGRRMSSAAEIGLPMSNDTHDLKSATGTISNVSGTSSTNFPSSESDLLPGEEYTHLLTPSLPFDPDFYETFATLCDILIDCYTKLMVLLADPKDCGPHIAEMFTKTDARVRKIIVQGVVKEFEDSSRSGVKSEVAGVGKVVLGGLM